MPLEAYLIISWVAVYHVICIIDYLLKSIDISIIISRKFCSTWCVHTLREYCITLRWREKCRSSISINRFPERNLNTIMTENTLTSVCVSDLVNNPKWWINSCHAWLNVQLCTAKYSCTSIEIGLIFVAYTILGGDGVKDGVSNLHETKRYNY